MTDEQELSPKAQQLRDNWPPERIAAEMQRHSQPRQLSPGAQHLRNTWPWQRIAAELYRVSNGRVDWRVPEDKPNVTHINGEWNNRPIQTSADRAYEAELSAAMGRHPSGKALTPAPKLPGTIKPKRQPGRAR